MPNRSKEDQDAYAAAKFQVRSGARGFVQMGPRYWRPVDDTTVLAIDPHPVHGYGVLLERNDFTDLLAWLCRTKSGTHRITGTQMSAELTMGSDGLRIKCAYNTSPLMCQSTGLDPAAVGKLIEWMDDKEVNGWAGWRSGVTKREPLKEVVPAKADWTLNIVVDRGTGYLADGDDYYYFTGPEDMDEEEWREFADRVAFPNELVEFTALATPQGRWWKTGRKASYSAR
jgi:hypothetical protein